MRICIALYGMCYVFFFMFIIRCYFLLKENEHYLLSVFRHHNFLNHDFCIFFFPHPKTVVDPCGDEYLTYTESACFSTYDSQVKATLKASKTHSFSCKQTTSGVIHLLPVILRIRSLNS